MAPVNYTSGLDHRLRLRVCREPQRACGAGRIELEFLPPSSFITVTVELAMMSPAERDRELVADLAAERMVLRKAQVMGVARLTSADDASLLGHKPHMVPIANTPRLAVCQHRFVDQW